MFISKIERFSGRSDWIGLGFVERERTPRQIIEVGIQLHIAVLSLSNTKQYIENLGVTRSRTAIHNWVQKADLQPISEVEPNHIAVEETVIQLNDERWWLYAAVDPETNEFLHVKLFSTRTTQLTVHFLRELKQKMPVTQATILVDDAHHLKAALSRLGLRFQMRRHGNRNAAERVFKKVKRRTFSLSNTFSHVKPMTAESWLQAFAVWWNHVYLTRSVSRSLPLFSQSRSDPRILRSSLSGVSSNNSYAHELDGLIGMSYNDRYGHISKYTANAVLRSLLTVVLNVIFDYWASLRACSSPRDIDGVRRVVYQPK